MFQVRANILCHILSPYKINIYTFHWRDKAEGTESGVDIDWTNSPHSGLSIHGDQLCVCGRGNKKGDKATPYLKSANIAS